MVKITKNGKEIKVSDIVLSDETKKIIVNIINK
jgi:hypothetical protein